MTEPKPRRKGAKAHTKGPRGEREVAKILMEWWTPHYPEAVFTKTPGSGGFGGINRKHMAIRAGMKMSGDIMTTLEEFPFCVEVKREQNWSMERLLAGRPTKVWSFWKQCVTAALEQDGHPMLWFRRNREPWNVMLSFDYAKEFPLPPPVAVWSKTQLLGVDHGLLVPIMYAGEDILKVDPKIFVR